MCEVYLVWSNNQLVLATRFEELTGAEKYCIETLQENACREAGRNFIVNEWERFFPGQQYRTTCENLPVHPSALKAEAAAETTS